MRGPNTFHALSNCRQLVSSFGRRGGLLYYSRRQRARGCVLVYCRKLYPPSPPLAGWLASPPPAEHTKLFPGGDTFPTRCEIFADFFSDFTSCGSWSESRSPSPPRSHRLKRTGPTPEHAAQPGPFQYKAVSNKAGGAAKGGGKKTMKTRQLATMEAEQPHLQHSPPPDHPGCRTSWPEEQP